MNLLDLTPDAAFRVLDDWIAARGDPRYRAKQIFPRLWQRPALRWTECTDLPGALARELEQHFPLTRPTLIAKQTSTDGTVKFLWQFDPRTAVESVLIPDRSRRTLCISSQAGCAYGCTFCATGRMGFERHLAPWEITAQVRELAADPDIGSPTNVVFMGMGEPLHNWAAVDRALTILNHPQGLGIGARRITVSTIGIVPNLRKLAARPEQFRVALSLHAPFSASRRTLMPVEAKYPLRDVLEELKRFPRRVTCEYVMIAGVNDSPEDARELAKHARTLGALVNILPLHPGGAPGLQPTSRARIHEFAAELRRLGANATVRRSRGLDISAACGQLRVETEQLGHIQPEQHADIEQ